MEPIMVKAYRRHPSFDKFPSICPKLRHALITMGFSEGTADDLINKALAGINESHEKTALSLDEIVALYLLREQVPDALPHNRSCHSETIVKRLNITHNDHRWALYRDLVSVAADKLPGFTGTVYYLSEDEFSKIHSFESGWIVASGNKEAVHLQTVEYYPREATVMKILSANTKDLSCVFPDDSHQPVLILSGTRMEVVGVDEQLPGVSVEQLHPTTSGGPIHQPRKQSLAGSTKDSTSSLEQPEVDANSNGDALQKQFLEAVFALGAAYDKSSWNRSLTELRAVIKTLPMHDDFLKPECTKYFIGTVNEVLRTNLDLALLDRICEIIALFASLCETAAKCLVDKTIHQLTRVVVIYDKESTLIKSAITTIAVILSRSTACESLQIDFKFIEQIVTSMRAHPTVQEAGSLILCELIRRNKIYRDIILGTYTHVNEGLRQLLKTMSNPPDDFGSYAMKKMCCTLADIASEGNGKSQQELLMCSGALAALASVAAHSMNNVAAVTAVMRAFSSLAFSISMYAHSDQKMVNHPTRNASIATVLRIMIYHPENVGIQLLGCESLRRFVGSPKEERVFHRYVTGLSRQDVASVVLALLENKVHQTNVELMTSCIETLDILAHRPFYQRLLSATDTVSVLCKVACQLNNTRFFQLSAQLLTKLAYYDVGARLLLRNESKQYLQTLLADMKNGASFKALLDSMTITLVSTKLLSKKEKIDLSEGSVLANWYLRFVKTQLLPAENGNHTLAPATFVKLRELYPFIKEASVPDLISHLTTILLECYQNYAVQLDGLRLLAMLTKSENRHCYLHQVALQCAVVPFNRFKEESLTEVAMVLISRVVLSTDVQYDVWCSSRKDSTDSILSTFECEAKPRGEPSTSTNRPILRPRAIVKAMNAFENNESIHLTGSKLLVTLCHKIPSCSLSLVATALPAIRRMFTVMRSSTSCQLWACRVLAVMLEPLSDEETFQYATKDLVQLVISAMRTHKQSNQSSDLLLAGFKLFTSINWPGPEAHHIFEQCPPLIWASLALDPQSNGALHQVALVLLRQCLGNEEWSTDRTKLVVRTMKSHGNDKGMQEAGLEIMRLKGNLAAMREKLCNVGGVEALSIALENHPLHRSINHCAFTFLRRLIDAGDLPLTTELRQLNFPKLIWNALITFPNDALLRQNCKYLEAKFENIPLPTDPAPVHYELNADE